MRKYPKKAKLVNKYGFYRIIELNTFVPRILYPVVSGIDFEFEFYSVMGKYAIYKQV